MICIIAVIAGLLIIVVLILFIYELLNKYSKWTKKEKFREWEDKLDLHGKLFSEEQDISLEIKIEEAKLYFDEYIKNGVLKEDLSKNDIMRISEKISQYNKVIKNVENDLLKKGLGERNKYKHHIDKIRDILNIFKKNGRFNNSAYLYDCFASLDKIYPSKLETI